MRTILTAINSKYIHTALGLRYVSAYCRSKGHDVLLIEDSINSPILAVLDKIIAAQGDIYGFSVHIWNKLFVYRLIKMLRSLKPEVKIAVGGPEVSFAAAKTFMELPEIDFIIQGEGETTFSDLLQSVQENTPLPPHIACKKNFLAGSMKETPAVIEDLSLLPFPYPDLEKVIAEKKILYYECTRGCPFKCSYCLSGISRSVRRRPLPLVLQDLDRFIQAKAPLVKFVDRTYNLSEDYYLPIMQHLAQSDASTTFHFEIKADLLSDKVLKFLQTVPPGRFQFEIGVQTTNKPTLKAINRHDDWNKLKYNCTKILGFKNIHLHLDLIAGLPFEGLKEFAHSFNDVYSLQPHMLQLGFLKVLPGTQMEQETKLHQLVYMPEPPYEILATKYIAYEELQFLRQLENVFEQTYNTGAFANTLRHMIKLRSPGDAFAFYSHLTNWWVKNGHYPQTHNLKSTAAILYNFATEHYTEDLHTLKEILRYDVFCSIPGWKPEWLNWRADKMFDRISAFWRNEELVKRYLPDYQFSSWRQIHKNYPVEYFTLDPQTGEARAYFILLDCSGDSQTIREIDF